MTDKTDLASREAKEIRESTEQEPAIRPFVDIFEDETGITVQADMPGVSRERLEVRVDSDTLSIEGLADISMPDGMEALYADIRATRYQRSFALSGELDGEKAEASLKEGVLTLRIPKRSQYQPRKIEVRAG